MKTFLKSTALLIILSFCGKELFAQGFYFRGGLGYAIPQAGQTLDGTGTPYSGTSNNTMTIDSTKYTSYNISKVSFTSGVHISIAGGDICLISMLVLICQLVSVCLIRSIFLTIIMLQ